MTHFKTRSLKDIRFIIINLSFLWVISFASFRIVTINLITKSSNSLKFIDSIKSLPLNPQILLLLSMLYFLLLICCISYEHKLPVSNIIYIIYSITETALGLLLLDITGYSNNSILLLIAANLLLVPAKHEIKSFVIAVLLFLYILCLSNLPLSFTNSIPLESFLTIYNDNTVKIIIFAQTLMTTTINILFIIYAILFFMIEEQKTNRIYALNQQLDDANSKFKEANLKLKEYSKTVENMSKTEERNRLAKEIHDTIGHTLTNIISGLDASLILIDESIHDAKDQLTVLRDIASHCIIDIRRSVKALRPDALEKKSTKLAIDEMLNKINTSRVTRIINNNNLGERFYDNDEEEAIYRTVQESITNAIRHGEASMIKVSLCEENNVVHIIVKDNGHGCKHINEGFGIFHMKERISMLNGMIDFTENDGFEVNAYIPLRKRNI